MRNIALLAIAMITSLPAIAASPAQELKKNLVSSCVSRGLQRGDNPDAVYVFCSCTWEVLSNNLTVAEYVQLDTLSTTKNTPASLPFWTRLQPKLQACKEKEASAIKP